MQLPELGRRDPRSSQSLSTLFDCNHDQSKNDKFDEHDIQFIKPDEDAAESLQASEHTLDLIYLVVQLFVMFPRFCPLSGFFLAE